MKYENMKYEKYADDPCLIFRDTDVERIENNLNRNIETLTLSAIGVLKISKVYTLARIKPNPFFLDGKIQKPKNDEY